MALAIATLACVAATPVATFAQEGPGGSINPGRDCQTITTCNFKKSGSYRGCLSSYSCRVCKFVSAPCRAGKGKRCLESRCVWGA